MTLKIRIINL